jgi:hypothetical protein
MLSVESKLTYRAWNLDGVTYTLAIFDTREGFRGGWFCDSCCVFRFPDVITESFDDAITEAKRTALAHQRSKHCQEPNRTIVPVRICQDPRELRKSCSVSGCGTDDGVR